MLKVKNAYYLRSMPTKIALVLPDDSAKIADLTPWRDIREEELADLAALSQPAYRKAMLQDAMPDYILRFYGLEKIPM